MAMYESEITKFIRDLMEKNPDLVELQKRNRATWWDRKIDLDQQQRFENSKVSTQGYAYFPLPDAPKK